MQDTKGNEGINMLSGLLQGRMKEMSDKPAVLDFGTINADKSLTTNGFPQPIPKSDYMVCRLAQPTLKPGDRVIVAWVGDDACVIDAVISGSRL